MIEPRTLKGFRDHLPAQVRAVDERGKRVGDAAAIDDRAAVGDGFVARGHRGDIVIAG